jgi:hypothetical protein
MTRQATVIAAAATLAHQTHWRSCLAIILGAVAGAAALSPWPASGRAPCGPRAEIAEVLDREWRERPVAAGLSANGAMIELFLSAAGTWTLLLTLPAGAACVVASGEAWHERPPPESAL